jgi:hypothetical protein
VRLVGLPPRIMPPTLVVPVLSMRWASAGMMPVLAIISRDLQKMAAMLAT